MTFFNSKKFEIVSVTSQDVVELDSANRLSFYIKDVFLGTTITSVDYLAISKSGRSDTVLGSYVNISNISGDIYTFDYTPTGLAEGTQIKFRLKLTDADGDEHFITTNDFAVITST